MFGATALRAQQAPPQAPPVLQVPPPTLTRPPEPTPIEPGELPASPDPASGPIPAGADKVIVTPVEITLQGGSVYSPDQLAPLIQPLIGKPVPAAEIFRLAQAIERKYRDDGYFLALVRVPPQRVADGRIRLQVVEGRISGVVVDGTAGRVQEKVREYLEQLVGRTPVRLRDMERYLLLANDLPGVRVKGVLRPGAEQGTSELVAEVSRAPVDFFGQVDNRGSSFSGPVQGTFVAGINSHTEAAERLEGTFYTTFSNQSTFGQLSMSGAVGAEGLRLRGYGGIGSSLPGGALQLAQYEGRTTVAGVSASYPAIRSRDLNLNLSGGADYYRSVTDVFGNVRLFESNLRSIHFAVDGSLADAWSGVTYGNVRVRKGLEIFGSTTVTSPLLPRAGMDPAYTKAAGDIARLQRIWGNDVVAIGLLATLSWQYTDSVLPPNEKFFLGGDRNGRGYYAGQVTGDRAVGGGVELQVDLWLPESPAWLSAGGVLPVQLYGFFDWGNAWNLAPGEVPSVALRSVGAGVRLKVLERTTLEGELVHRLDLQVDGAAATPLAPFAAFARLTTRF